MSTSELDELFLFSSRFREERERLGYKNQKSLADRLRVDIKTIGKYERAETFPTALQLMIFKGLGADISYLFNGVRQTVAEALTKAHANHVNRLVDSIVSAELDEDDAELLESLAQRLGR